MLQRVTLHLARCHDFPDGSADHGYDMVAPLDADGRLDLEEWKGVRTICRVHRFWGNEEDRIGRLSHRAGGRGGATWIFDYNSNLSTDDEEGFRLDAKRFTVGEYVTIAEADGREHCFVVTMVRPALEQSSHTGTAPDSLRKGTQELPHRVLR